MQYAPTAAELEESKQQTAAQRMQYCLTRIVEAEEVWGLAEEEGWIINVVDGQDTLPIWPYKAFAWQCIPAKWPNAETQAISLEHFIDNVSQMLAGNNIMVEIFPTPLKQGEVIESRELFKMLQGMMDSGEYYLEQ